MTTTSHKTATEEMELYEMQKAVGNTGNLTFTEYVKFNTLTREFDQYSETLGFNLAEEMEMYDLTPRQTSTLYKAIDALNDVWDLVKTPNKESIKILQKAVIKAKKTAAYANKVMVNLI